MHNLQNKLIKFDISSAIITVSLK